MRRAALRQAQDAAALLRAEAAAPMAGMLRSEGPSYAAASSAAQHQQQRGLQLFDIFSKENRAKRKKRLQEDLQRGYFDDFKELKDTGGKLWRSPDRLSPADAAQPFPPIKVVRPDKVATAFPLAPEEAPAASLVCIGFKDGAEDMLATWSDPFVEAFQGSEDAGLVELSVVESQVMALWPFRNMILAAPRRAAKAAAAAAERDSSAAVSPTQQAAAAAGDNAAAAEAGAAAIQAGGSQSSARSGGRNSSGSSEGHRASGAAQPESSDPGGGSGGGSSNDGSEPAAALLTAGDPPVLRDRRPRHLHSEYLFYFGDAYDLCAALHISNRLTGYAFLLDRKGRVRFRGCGKAEAAERENFVTAAQQLLNGG